MSTLRQTPHAPHSPQQLQAPHLVGLAWHLYSTLHTCWDVSSTLGATQMVGGGRGSPAEHGRCLKEGGIEANGLQLDSIYIPLCS